MKIYVSFDLSITRNAVLKEQLDKLGVGYKIQHSKEITFDDKLTLKNKSDLVILFSKYGVSIIEDQKKSLVQRIKDAINDLLLQDQVNPHNLSFYLAEKLNYSYAYLSSIFSENTHTSIENFVILKKVDLVKDFIANTDLTLTEIAFKLHYSSVAHLSGQFKKTTGLTPSSFQKIIQKRKEFNLI